ncbi:hypothetical protein ACTJJ4_03030 [Microbacterium sp. 22195]|uniref:hypothetical protein n=1 Tax=Microbacterium sp. 22195 TaxID=3453891 RepID=UPI003F8605F4
MTRFHRTKEWASFSKKARPILAAALPLPCVNAYRWEGCRGVVMPGEAFDVAHIISHNVDPFQPLDMSMVGAAHQRCNRRAGAAEGGRKRAQQKARGGDDKRLPPAGSGW